MRAPGLGWAIGGWVLLWAAMAGAEGATDSGLDPAEPDASRLADVVRLANGDALRGVIVELEPNVHVVIRLPTGEERTIPAARFTYAGSATGDPGPAAVEPPAQRVRFVTEQRRLQLYLAPGQPGARPEKSVAFGPRRYQLLCDAPCEVQMAPGHYTVAVGSAGKEPLLLPRRLWVNPGDTVQASYTDESSRRRGGWWLFGGALLTGIACSAGAVALDQAGFLYFPAVISAGVFAPIGLVIAFESDSAEVEIRPAPRAAVARSTLAVPRF